MYLNSYFFTLIYNRYGKTKDVFGWPEESEDSQNQPQSSGQQVSNTSNEPELSPVSSPSMPLLDRYIYIFFFYGLSY